MNTRYFIASLGAALIAAGESLRVSAENAPEDILGIEVAGPGDETLQPGEVMAGNASLDSAGLPWHPSIHAGTKKFKGDGTWTRKKAVSDVEYNAIVAELRKTHPAPTVTAPAPTAPTPPAGNGAPALPTLNLTPTMPALTLPTAPPPPKTNYALLCEWLAENADKGGPLTSEWVNAQLAANGVSVEKLAADEALSAIWLKSFKGAVGQA